MLYVYHGTEIEKSREKSHKLVDSLRAKRPDATYVYMSADNWDRNVVDENIGGQGLFSNKYIVFFDRISENSEAKEILPKYAEDLKKSENIFIILEAKINAEWKKTIEKSADKAVVADMVSVKAPFKDEGFNIFALSDAVGNRNRFLSWSTFRQAVDSGEELESILGTIFWQLKTMAVAGGANTAAEAGISPFVFSKSKKYAANYPKNDLSKLLQDVVTLYHDGHRGIADLELATEKLLLHL